MIRGTIAFNTKQERSFLTRVLDCEVDEESCNSNLGDNFKSFFFQNGTNGVFEMIRRLGMLSPIYIDTVDTFRVVFPLSNEFGNWVMPKDRDFNQSEKDIASLFILKLIVVLKELDENIVSSAFSSTYGMSLDKSSFWLARLSEDGILNRHATKTQVSWWDESFGWPRTVPYYTINNEVDLQSSISNLLSKMHVFPAPTRMSPTGLYALSRWSCGNLEEKDFRNVLWKIFAYEGVYGETEMVDLISAHFEIIARNRTFGDVSKPWLCGSRPKP